jgi:hypothetical protein
MEAVISKTLRTAALVVGAVALIATGVGAGIALSAGTTLAAASATTVVAGVSLGTIATIASVASAALSLAAGLTMKKPSALASGSPDRFEANPDAGVPYVIGRFATAGNIVFRRAWDTLDKGDNDRQSFVVTYSLGPVTEYESFTVDQAAVTFTGAGQALGEYSTFMWRTTQMGDCPEPAALSFGTGAGFPPGWDASRKLSGLAAATWTLRFDTKSKHYQNGVPNPRAVIKGVRVYDPRLDGSYPGGVGPQRVDDESSWAYSTNPYLHGLTWCLGRFQNGQRVMGLGAPIRGIDVAAFVEGANIADLNGWKVAGVAYSADDKWDVLKKILQAGMGEPVQLGASISCFVNAPKVSLATVSVGDVVGEVIVTATQPRKSRINGIVPRYWQEQNDWQFLPGTAVRVALHETEDGGRRTKTVDYPFVPSDAAGPDFSDKQIAVACRYDIENAREFGPITLPLKLRWIGYKPGDCITVNLPTVGLNSQAVLLLNRDFDPGAAVPTFTARSETNGKHAFALGQVSSPPPTPGVSGEALVPVPGNAAWAIVATGITTGENATPALVIEGAVDSPVAEAIVVEYRHWVDGQAIDANWSAWGTFAPAATQVIITGVQPDTVYEVAMSYRRRGIVGARTVLGPVVVGRALLDYANVTGPTRPEDNATVGAPAGTDVAGTPAEVLLADIAAARADLDAVLLQAAELAANLRSTLTSFLSANLLAETRQLRNDALGFLDGIKLGVVIRRETTSRIDGDTAILTDLSLLGAKSGDSTAWILDIDTVMVSPVLSVGQRFSEIDAAIVTVNGAVSANYTELTTAIADESEARVTAFTSLTASLNDEIGNREAAVMTLSEAIVNEGEARATLGTALNARMDGVEGDLAAAVTTLEEAVADANEARATAVTTLDARIDGVEGDLAAAVTSFDEAVADANEARATAIDAVNATVDSLTGTVATQATVLATLGGKVEAYWQVDVNAGSGATAFISARAEVGGVPTSNVSFGAKEVHVFNDVDGEWKKALSVVGGKVVASDVEVDTLKVNTAIIPVRAAATSPIAGTDPVTTDTPDPFEVLSVIITMTQPGWIEAVGGGQQGYAAPSQYQANIKVNGVQIPEAVVGNGAGSAQGSFLTQGAFYVDTPDDYEVTLNWNAYEQLTLNQRSLLVKGYPYTE